MLAARSGGGRALSEALFEPRQLGAWHLSFFPVSSSSSYSRNKAKRKKALSSCVLVSVALQVKGLQLSSVHMYQELVVFYLMCYES